MKNLTEKEISALKYIMNEWGELIEKVIKNQLEQVEEQIGIKDTEWNTTISCISYIAKKEAFNNLINNLKNL